MGMAEDVLEHQVTLAPLFPKVLGWVNEERKKLGYGRIERLPMGVPNNKVGCVLARAFSDCGVHVEEDGRGSVDVYHGGKITTLQQPEHVVAFVDAFDRGFIPQLTIPHGMRGLSRQDYSSPLKTGTCDY